MISSVLTPVFTIIDQIFSLIWLPISTLFGVAAPTVGTFVNPVLGLFGQSV